jgi:hypothetical protein
VLLGVLVVPVDLEFLPLRGPSSTETNVAPSFVIATTSPSSISCTRLVSRRNAAIDEARNISSSPMPTTSGHCRRAPTSISGCSRWMTTKAKCPSSCA